MNVLLRRVPKSMVCNHVFYSTRTLRGPPRTSSSYSAGTKLLFAQIMRSGDPSSSMTEILDKWVEQGNNADQSLLTVIVKTLRKYRRFTHALQVFEWMSKEGNKELSSAQLAFQLDLISKVHGLEQAEKNFDQIPEASRCYLVYGTLLNCYAYKYSVEKAEAIMQKMRELGFVRTLLPYNSLLTAYVRKGDTAKMDSLLKEMEDKGIEWDAYTYNICMNAYVAASDFKAMEKLQMKMELDPHVTLNWHSYVVAANGYLKSGQIEKTLTILKRVEHLANGDQNAFQFLITLYAAAGKKDEVYRIWNQYSSNGKFLNNNYLAMISSLLKLDDIAGAESIMDKWERGRSHFDSRIPKLIISAFCGRGWLEKAEAYINRLLEIGEEPKSQIWYTMARGYHAGNQMEKAVEALKKAIPSSSAKWEPNPAFLSACLDHLKEKGDDKTAEDLLACLQNRSSSAGSG